MDQYLETGSYNPEAAIAAPEQYMAIGWREQEHLRYSTSNAPWPDGADRPKSKREIPTAQSCQHGMLTLLRRPNIAI